MPESETPDGFDGDIATRLQQALEELPAALARIAKYILENPEKVLRQSVAELGEFSGSGEASIVRLCRQLGFSGYRDFKLALAAELGRPPAPPAGAGAIGGPDAAAGAELRALHDSLVQTIGTAHARAAPARLAAVARALDGARRIDVYGAGASGIAAELLAYCLLRQGLTTQAFRDANMAHEVAHGLGPGCVAIGVSESGLTADTIQFLKFARATGATAVAMVNRLKSPLAEVADHVLHGASPAWRAVGGSIGAAPGHAYVIEALALSLARVRREGGGPE